MLRSALHFGLALALVAVTGMGSGTQAAEGGAKTAGTEIGQYAPDFQVFNMKGEKVTLTDLKGKPLFVNFWAWWCPPCIKEAELFMHIAKKYEGRITFVFIGVNRFYKDNQPLDPQEIAEGYGPALERFKQGLRKARLVRPDSLTLANHPERLPEFKTRNREVIDYYLNSPTSLFDFRGYWERQFRAKTNEKYGIPVTYLIDPEGKVALDVHPNEQYWDQNDDILEDFIAGRDLRKYQDRFVIPEHHRRKPETASQ